ncbi:PadR family transcriptional regulator [Boudabousia liubingyangii]|uniref:PadR family transcriptional regulator n=1 Tax=Boudabousia liubingyangii TaxID=1921764 RepID=UPI00093A9F94|nr:PadR family transcriptional regulator [Boudabousia liubingyangii]OKL47025.1 PadR family transcriptional regulator [Boudabousia liubingyangii]
MAESQLRKGAVELIVLGLLDSCASYGGQLLERLTQEAGIEVSSGTLYPLLSRLRKSGLVDTSWEESPVGPPRKIYKLTRLGRERLIQMKQEWDLLALAVTQVTSKEGAER